MIKKERIIELCNKHFDTDANIWGQPEYSTDGSGVIDFVRAIEAEGAKVPAFFVVVDETGSPEYTALRPEFCHEHINTALNEDLIEGAEKWKVVSVYTEPPDLTAEAEKKEPVGDIRTNPDDQGNVNRWVELYDNAPDSGFIYTAPPAITAENHRRAIACLKACAGIPTEILEAPDSDSQMIARKAWAQYENVLCRNEELRAEVEFMLGKYEEMLDGWLPQKKRIAELEAACDTWKARAEFSYQERSKLERSVMTLEHDNLKLTAHNLNMVNALEKVRERLDKLARLGNGNSFGNSVGNQIAVEAIATINEVLE